MKNKKKVNAKAAQKEVERELSEDSLGQVAGGLEVFSGIDPKLITPLTGDPEFDRRQSESFSPSLRGGFNLISSENE